MIKNKMTKLSFLFVCYLFLSIGGQSAFAGFTETLPKHAFMLEEAFVYAWANGRFDDGGNHVPLIEEIEMYEAGAGLQGILRPKPEVINMALITQLQFGLFDFLSFGFGVPVMLKTDIDPNLNWIPGDYQSRLGRRFTEDDFWDWASAMGQPKPTAFHGNRGQVGDMILGLRYRFTDHIKWFDETKWAIALTPSFNIPTGRVADPEELVDLGTTNTDLQSQGDISIHLGIDKWFAGVLHKRLMLGLDLFYDVFWSRERTTPTGEKNPLLLNYDYYVGKTYTYKPGDQMGFQFDISASPYVGPQMGTWLNGHNPENAKNLPAIIKVAVRYSFTYLMQTEYSSKAPHWDFEKENDFFPGYKNHLTFQMVISLLRVGAPLQFYAKYRTMTLIPGKNVRAADSVMAGIQIPFKLWGFSSMKKKKPEAKDAPAKMQEAPAEAKTPSEISQ